MFNSFFAIRPLSSLQAGLFRSRGVSLFLMACLLGLVLFSCVERLTTSNGMTCSQKADCWDELPCLKDVCTAPDAPPEKGPEPKAEPRPEPKAEKVKDAGPTPERPVDKVAEKPAEVVKEAPPEPRPVDVAPDKPAGQCKGNLDANGFCKVDGDCCPGQKCTEIPDPRVPKGTSICGPCAADKDCPLGTVCCTAFKICASKCAP